MFPLLLSLLRSLPDTKHSAIQIRPQNRLSIPTVFLLSFFATAAANVRPRLIQRSADIAGHRAAGPTRKVTASYPFAANPPLRHGHGRVDIGDGQMHHVHGKLRDVPPDPPPQHRGGGAGATGGAAGAAVGSARRMPAGGRNGASGDREGLKRGVSGGAGRNGASWSSVEPAKENLGHDAFDGEETWFLPLMFFAIVLAIGHLVTQGKGNGKGFTRSGGGSTWGGWEKKGKQGKMSLGGRLKKEDTYTRDSSPLPSTHASPKHVSTRLPPPPQYPSNIPPPPPVHPHPSSVRERRSRIRTRDTRSASNVGIAIPRLPSLDNSEHLTPRKENFNTKLSSPTQKPSLMPPLALPSYLAFAQPAVLPRTNSPPVLSRQNTDKIDNSNQQNMLIRKPLSNSGEGSVEGSGGASGGESEGSWSWDRKNSADLNAGGTILPYSIDEADAPNSLLISPRQGVSLFHVPNGDEHVSYEKDGGRGKSNVLMSDLAGKEPLPIKHKRYDLSKEGSDASSSLTSIIDFSELSLEKVVGGGGFGQVWRANWRGTPVAVKILAGSAKETLSPNLLQEFLAEISMVSAMRHPNCILFMGACVNPPYPRAIVTELAARGSLWDALRQPLPMPYVVADGTTRDTWPEALYLTRGQQGMTADVEFGKEYHSMSNYALPEPGTWPWVLVKRVAEGAARAMSYLHSGNPPVLHRDLKSANLLLDESFTVKVCDFGLARLVAKSKSMTGNCGTVQWMAPEVLSSQKYSMPADVYSFGIILWELLVRECPYEGCTPIQCAMGILNEGVRPVIPQWCPQLLRILINDCVAQDPSVRPSFAQILTRIEEICPGNTTT